MPCKIKIKVLAGRNLPVMDRASDTTDAFVEIKFGGVTHKTDVCRKSLNPQWNSTEWYRFEVDESELQDEPLQLRVMDHDTYSANDAIGKVVISLAPLLAREPAPNVKGAAPPQTGAVMSGWIPVFDTMHGIRGELNVIVKVELFSDFNKYKTSSCGVQFFHCPMVPLGYRATAIHGFVEELVVNDDPEYQWIDKIRTPRASNEARQAAFIKLSNQVQRLVGLKAAELGANAVVGYQQAFDLEGEAGVVARAIGTAISIVALPTPSQPSTVPPCSQQQLRKYLDILVADNESITDLNDYFQTHQEELQKLMQILHPKFSSNFLDEQENDDDNDKRYNMSRQASIKTYTDSVSIYQHEFVSQQSLRHIAEDQSDLNKLLYSEAGNSEDEPSAALKIIKKMRPNFLKHFGISRSKKADTQADDQISIKSNSSDTSRMSLTEIKNEFKKLKRLKKPKFRRVVNNNDEGIGMASILARSVIHAHTSLACIAETQDSENSPNSTIHRTSESEPTINKSEEERTKTNESKQMIDKVPSEHAYLKRELPEVQFGSLKNVNLDEEINQNLHKNFSRSCPNTPMAGRISNFLKLPTEAGYFGSVSSALSCDSSEFYTSSDEDDESSDVKTDTEKSIETTSSIVQSVLKHEVNSPLITNDKKLNVPESKEQDALKSLRIKIFDTPQHANDKHFLDIPDQTQEANDVEDKVRYSESNIIPLFKNSRHHFKLHNPFTHKKVSKSFSAPSSPVDEPNFVYRSSKKLKNQLSKISKSSMMKSLSHYSLIPKKKHVGAALYSDHSSCSDIQGKGHSHETVLGSPFLSYTDLLSLDKENTDTFIKPKTVDDHRPNTNVKMYIGSEPVSRASISLPASPYIPDIHHKDDIHHETKSHKKDKPAINPTGLLHTAMETILMDKVHSLLIPTSPDPHDTNAKEKRFFSDVNEKLEKVEEMRNKDQELEGLKDESLKEGVHRKLVRQNSVHSSSENIAIDPSPNDLSKENKAHDRTPNTSHKSKSKPILQHLHPIMSGAIHPKLSHLETIPSLPESGSIDREFSIDDNDIDSRSTDHVPAYDINPIECKENLDETRVDFDPFERDCEVFETNNKVPLADSVVCDNSHAACRGPVLREKEREREKEKSEKDRGSPRHARHESYGGIDPATPANAQSQQNSSLNASSTPVGMHRRSSDSDLSITPKASSLNASAGNTGSGGGGAILKPSMNSNNIDMLEYPFLTMMEYPSGFIVNIGGTVCARSVKLVDGGGEAAARAAWWAELRTELRAHARALRCNAVLAYAESAAICEDVCVLSASGTAAVINLDCDFGAEVLDTSTTVPVEEPCACSLAHAPYSAGGGPYRAELATCGTCRRARVPGVLLATCARPAHLAAHAAHVPLTAVAARVRRAAPQAEPGARDISDQLPFLEYELHKLLLAKLRMQGANALFNLQTQIAVGERCVVALASGTAVRLAALPAPAPPRIKASENDKEALELQKALWDTFTANKAANGYDICLPEHISNGVLPEVESDEFPALDLCSDKDACVLELDETEDVETARSLSIRRCYMPVFTQHPQIHPAPGAKPYAFAQVWRARLSGGTPGAERHVARALDGVHYKLRTLRPAALSPVSFQIDLTEDEIQLMVSGAAIPLLDPSKIEHQLNGSEDSANVPSQGTLPQGHHTGQAMGTGDAEDDIFTLDEEQTGSAAKFTPVEMPEEKHSIPNNQASPAPSGVALTPLPHMLGARRSRWVCALRLLLVRETTAVRELGGLSGFVHAAVSEALAVVRAHTLALGGNALVSAHVAHLMLQDNAHKNQGQCLLSIGGDVVHVTY